MTDITKDPDNNSYIKRPVYIDTNTCIDNSLKISSNGDENKDGVPASIYDYFSLRNILRDEMDKPVTEKQAKIVGDALTDLYQALYFEDL